MNEDEQIKHYKSIKSFVKRAGRITVAQNRAISEYGDKYLIKFSKDLLNLEDIFLNKNPIIFEIGFGMGETTFNIAKTCPQNNFLCCDIHKPGIGSLLKLIHENNLENIKIIEYDAVEIINYMLPDFSLSGVHIFFPDPWHKKRHNKRRLIQSEFINNLINKMKLDSYIHCATDNEDYANHILEVLTNEKYLINTAKNFAIKPDYRPLTKFEKRGLNLNHNIFDLIFKKVKI